MRHKSVRILVVILMLLCMVSSAFWYAFVSYNVKRGRPERVVYDGHEVQLTRERDKRKPGGYSVVYKGYSGESPVFLTVAYKKEEYAALAPDAKLTGYAYYVVAYPAEYYLTFDHMAEKSEIDKTLRSQEIKLALILSVPGDILLIAAAALLLLLIRSRKGKEKTTGPAVT